MASTDDLVDVTECPLCGSIEQRTMFEQLPHKVVRCDTCSMVWVTPRLSAAALRSVYDEGYWTSAAPGERGYADYRRDAPMYLKTFERRLAYLRPWLGSPGRLLDVGCAAGYFMKVARDAGWRVDGVELSSEIAAHARDTFDLPVHVGTLADAPFAPATFDAVTLWDVVEHVPDPATLLVEARHLLTPNGVVLIETQDVSSRFARLLGRRWQHYKHDEHLYHFNPATIERLLGQAGLEMVHLTRRFAGKYVPVSFVAERSARLHPVVAAALRPLNRLERTPLYVNLHDEMIVIARAA